MALNYTLAAVFGTAAYIMTPTAWPRSYMAMALTLIMAIVYILVRIDFKKQFKFIPKAFFVIIVSLSAIIYVYTVYINKENKVHVHVENHVVVVCVVV